MKIEWIGVILCMIDASSSEAKTCNNWVVEKPPFREAPVCTTPKPMHRPVLEACLSLSLEGFGRRAPSLSPALDGSGGQKSLGERVALSIDVRMKSEFGSSSRIFEMWYGATYERQVIPWCICLQISWPCLVPPEIRAREIGQMVWGNASSMEENCEKMNERTAIDLMLLLGVAGAIELMNEDAISIN